MTRSDLSSSFSVKMSTGFFSRPRPPPPEVQTQLQVPRTLRIPAQLARVRSARKGSRIRDRPALRAVDRIGRRGLPESTDVERVNAINTGGHSRERDPRVLVHRVTRAFDISSRSPNVTLPNGSTARHLLPTLAENCRELRGVVQRGVRCNDRELSPRRY